jgi:spore germination protein KB
MFQNGKITPNQLRLLVTYSFIGAYILSVPAVIAAESKQDAWIAAILGTITALLLIWLYTILGSLMGNMTIIQYCKKIFGKWLGGFISFTFVIFMLLITMSYVWIAGDFLITQLMPETPLIVINLLFTIVVTYAVRLGLEPVGRAAEILYPWVLVGVISVFLFVLPDIKLENLMPVFEFGLLPVIRGTLLFHGVIPVTLVIFLMIFPNNISQLQQGRKSFILGTLVGGIIISTAITFSLLVLGADATERNAYPIYALAKKISIGHVFERLEAITAMVWIVTVFFQTFLYFYGTVIGLTQTFDLKGEKTFSLPLAMLIVIFSIVVYPNSTYAAQWDTSTWFSYALIYSWIFPLLLFIIGKLRKV